ncbi:hypothetical protein DSO57_1000248 [Entomophthora muscae]|uniref:Uncharacterized protein n=1 Tax=Entomophthora muscae TaxID=34485 RepID=A0ACC2SYH0_9FUNG|nr:hypothetical protein DSO57_1000248 [Entomophthora muscae]
MSTRDGLLFSAAWFRKNFLIAIAAIKLPGSFPGFLLLPLRWAPALSSGINGKLIALIMTLGVQQQIIGTFFIGCTRRVPLQSDFERR